MEFLKDVLGEELYGQVADKLKATDIKLADLSKGEYVAKGKFTDLEAKYSTLEQTAKDYNDQITELSKEDAKGLKAKLEAVTKERDEKQKEFDAKLAKIEFNSKLDAELSKAKVRNPKAAKALLNLENVKLDGEQFLGLNDQLTALKESDGYLFNDSTNTGGGANPANAEKTTGKTFTRQQIENMSQAEVTANYDAIMKSGVLSK